MPNPCDHYLESYIYILLYMNDLTQFNYLREIKSNNNVNIERSDDKAWIYCVDFGVELMIYLGSNKVKTDSDPQEAVG